jgi:hypothetical protein
MLNSTRKFITIGVCFSTGHLILTFLSIVIPFVLGAPRFDNPDLPVSTLEEVASFLSSILIQPMWYLVHSIHLTPNGTILEWSLLLLNSPLWGFCLALLLSEGFGDRHNQHKQSKLTVQSKDESQ